MKNRLPAYRSVKAVVTGSLLVSVPYLLFLLPSADVLGVLPAVYASLITLFLLPLALCLAAAVCGTAAAGVGLAVSVGAMAFLTGKEGVTLTLIYVLPVLSAFFVLVLWNVPFKKSCFILIGVHLLGLSLVYLLAQRLAGGDLYAKAGSAVASYFETWDMGDTMLYQLYAMRQIDLKSELADSALLQVPGGYQLSAAARADMLLSLRSLISSLLQGFVPSTLVSQSILGGVTCLLLPLRFGFLAEEKRAFLRESPVHEEGVKQEVDFPDLGMTPFSMWHLPRGVGWQVGAALAAGYVLRMVNQPVAAIAGAILYAGASSVFTVQGAAAMNFLQKSRGVRRTWRVVVPLLLEAVSLLMLIGVFDQISNFRGLRKPPEPKEDFE